MFWSAGFFWSSGRAIRFASVWRRTQRWLRRATRNRWWGKLSCCFWLRRQIWSSAVWRDTRAVCRLLTDIRSSRNARRWRSRSDANKSDWSVLAGGLQCRWGTRDRSTARKPDWETNPNTEPGTRCNRLDVAAPDGWKRSGKPNPWVEHKPFWAVASPPVWQSLAHVVSALVFPLLTSC